MQHSNNGAVLGATGGAGRGRRVPGPSPALFLSYTNSPASTPSAEPKGPGGRGACGETRGARRRRLGRRGEGLKRESRVHVHSDLSTRLDARRTAPVLQGRATDRNREGPALQQQRAHFYAHPPTLHPTSLGSGRG